MAQELHRLFYPSSLAVIGASKNDMKGGGYILKGLISGGFKGKLYPVNPREPELMGLKCYPSVLDIPGEIDVVILAVPADLVPRLVAECCQKNVGFVVVHSVGFSELGAAGKALENKILQVSKQYRTRIVGPNCMGLYSPAIGLNTIVPKANLDSDAGNIAFISQSGWAAENLIHVGYERGLRFSQGVSIGNQCDLTAEDCLQYFAEDANTKVIVAYIEGIKRGREFFNLAKQITMKKPLIVFKGGRTESGAKATASHTGSLAGDINVFNALVRQSGIISAQNLEEMVDLTVGFICPLLPGGSRLGVLVEAGGGAVASTDISEELGLSIPTLSLGMQKSLMKILRDRLPASSSRHNPVDLVWVPGDISSEVYVQCSRIILKEVDALLIVGYVPLNDQFAAALAEVRDELKKPIFFIPGWHTLQRQGMSVMTRTGIPTFSIPERGLRVLAAMIRYANYLSTGK